jgi:hypothetical protein
LHLPLMVKLADFILPPLARRFGLCPYCHQLRSELIKRFFSAP